MLYWGIVMITSMGIEIYLRRRYNQSNMFLYNYIEVKNHVLHDLSADEPPVESMGCSVWVNGSENLFFGSQIQCLRTGQLFYNYLEQPF